MSDLKIAIGRFYHETNTFSTVRLRLEDFDPIKGNDILKAYTGTRTEMGGFIDLLTQSGIDIVPAFAASATPSGPIASQDFQRLTEIVVDGIEGAEDPDGVLLSLHGSMVAVNVPETEGLILRKVRKVVGNIPVIVTLDLHAMVSESIVENCNAIFGYNTNPHVDLYERGVEAAHTMIRAIRNEIKPMVCFKKLRMMPPTINQRTTEGPMVKLFETAYKMETTRDVLNVSIFGGYPYADVERAGSSVVVVTDGDPELGKNLREELSDQMWARRREFLKEITPIEVAVERAIQVEERPVVLADVADNPGGGAPGDSTFVLKELLTRKARNVGVAVIKDPQAVEEAVKIGVRGVLKTTIGGKTDGYHGAPLAVTGIVRTITDGIFIHKAGGIGLRADVGRTAVIDVDGVEIILAEKSHAPNDPEIFRRNGIEPSEKKILLLKSRGHFRAAYEPFCKEVIEVDAPGLTTPNLKWFSYKNVPRPIFPLDDI